MKLIVLDCLRRWRWLYLLGFITATILDIEAAFLPSFNLFTPYFLAPFLGPLFVAGYDLMRGAVGVTIALPVSVRKLGLGYWIVGVCVPPVLLSLALIFAAIIVSQFNPATTPGWNQVGLTFIISFLIGGGIFFVLTFFTPGPQEGLWNNIAAGLAGAFWGVSAFSGIAVKFLLDFRKGDAITITSLVCVALLLSVVGFLRCGEVVRLRARNRVARQRPVGKSSIEADVTRPSERGISGFPLLFFDSIKFSLGMAAVLVLFGVLLRSFIRIDSMFIHYSLVICALLPSLRYLQGLRQMRALPISLDGLASTLFVLPLVNFSVCLGVILLAQAITAPGTPNPIPMALLFSGAIASFGNSLVVRFGPKSLPFIFGIGIMAFFPFQMAFFTNLSFAGYCAISALSGLLMIASFVVLRSSLQSSKIYRLPAASFSVG